MTLRLVALMSVVLLLSLTAFGLLMNHYQAEVMEEVARTASDVGKATLGTFEFREGAPGGPAGLPAANVEHFVTRERITSRAGDFDPEAEGLTDRPRWRTVTVRSMGEGTRVKRLEGVGPVIFPEGEAGERVWHQQINCGGELAEHAEHAETCEELQKRLVKQLESAEGQDVMAQMFINLDAVHVESEEGRMMLKIPTFTPATEDGETVLDYQLHARIDDVPADAVMFAAREEIQLPIAVDDYQERFRSLRRRSLFAALGVFVVGMVLSAGLATRFTRPIRKLDDGIRRISEGELEAEVEVSGQDEIARLGIAFNDMSKQLRASRDRSREMVRREKLSALGGLAAGVAHDVRNPLHSIGLTLAHLNETCRPEADVKSEEFDRCLEIIRGEIRRLDQLIGNFLRFARTDRRDRQSVDLADLLRETARLIRKEAEWRRIDVELDLLETAPAVSADGETIRSSILNLVLNSFDSMPDGGKLTLRLGVAGDRVEVDVIDTGKGIPEEDQERVFEFAYTTREGGTGLGLAMVHQCIVEEHGGRVSLDSEPDRGTRVTLGIPLVAPEREDGA